MKTIVINHHRLNARIAGAYQLHVTAAVHGVATKIGPRSPARKERAIGEIDMTPARVRLVKSDGRMVRRINVK